MVLEYKSTIDMEEIAKVLDEHVVWYGQLMRVFFERQGDKKPVPSVFKSWIEKSVADGTLAKNTAERISRLHADLVKAADHFMGVALLGGDMPAAEFNELTRHYEEFIQAMRQIERDQALENSGFDDRTGLRSVKVMHEDLNRELSRRARRGNPFSLALVKINNYKESWLEQEDSYYLTIRKLADQIKFCLRSFDDAYHMGGEYFLLSLKHADILGSQAAIVRLNGSVNAAHITVPGGTEEISVGVVVAEVSAGDEIDTLIENMKKDLSGVDVHGTVLQYNDISPLQRYIHSIGSKE